MDFEFEAGLRFLQGLEIDTFELACGGYVTDLRYGDPDVLLDDESKLSAWRDAYERHGLTIRALSIHGQPLSPDPQIAKTYAHQFRQACRLAEAIGAQTLTLLAGLPEGASGESTPCWVVAPPEFQPTNADILAWQWEERVIPYWQEHARIAEDHGCRLCFEMLAADVVYNPRSLMMLRDAIGPVVGCNFDPSHLFWQGIDVFEALRVLGDAVYWVHAKDLRIEEHNVRVNGVLDVTPSSDIQNRAWNFATVGYGHDDGFWRKFVTALRLIGYDDTLSIEHEDETMTLSEGLEKAVRFLSPLVLINPADTSFMSRTYSFVSDEDAD